MLYVIPQEKQAVKHSAQYICLQLGMVAHVYNHSMWRAEAGGL
jgi:hypothetical protein